MCREGKKIVRIRTSQKIFPSICAKHSPAKKEPMAITSDKRAKFLEQQRAHFKTKTNNVIRLIKEERFQIEDDCHEYKNAYNQGGSVDFGIMMCLTTRTKIHIIGLEALKKMRNFQDDIDISRLPKLVRVHANQLRKIGTKNAEANIQFYCSMLNSIEHGIEWLRVIK